MASHDDPNAILIFFLVFFLLFIIIGCGCGGGYYYHNYHCKDNFEDFELKQGTQNIPNVDHSYNALYTDKFHYTEPPGDVAAQEYAGSGQGTRGEFLPLQGLQAGTFMKNSAENNRALPSRNTGIIGGQANYTTKDMTDAWIGFNNFPLPPGDPKEASNSYLIESANARVCSPGQRCNNLPAPEWYPVIKKDNKGFAVQGSDLLVTCTAPNKSITTCEEGQRFVRYKNEPEYRKVMNSF